MSAARRDRSAVRAGPRLAVFGFFGCTNLGNEATLAAFLYHWRRRFPESTVACIAPHESVVAETFGLPLIGLEPLSVRRRLHRRFGSLGYRLGTLAHRATEPVRSLAARRRLTPFDCVIVPGTGILDDYRQSPYDLPQQLSRWCVAARRSSLPVIFLSVGAERVEEPACRRYFLEAASGAIYRSYRDHDSMEHARNLGIAATADAVYPDLAFGLPAEWLPPSRDVSWPPRCVGIGVMGYYGWNKPGHQGTIIYERYLGKLRRFIGWLLEQRYSVRLLIGDTQVDARPVRDLLDTFAPPNDDEPQLIAEPIASYSDLLDQIVQTDVVIATRLHNVLLSLLMGRPTIALSYSRKTDSLLRLYEDAAGSQDIEAFDVDHLIVQFSELTRRPVAPTSLIATRNAEFRRQLDEQFTRVFSMLA